jgi:putative cell wall-binding protein
LLASSAIAAPTTAAAAPKPQTNFGSATVTTEELGGTDSCSTTLAISRSLSPNGSVRVVYLISSDAAAAIAAGPAAARDGGVVVCTSGSSLGTDAADELARLNPQRVEVVGGPAAVSDTVMSQVADRLGTSAVVERVSGDDAYSTAAAISAASFEANTGATFHAIAPGRVLDSRIPLGATRFHSRVKQSFGVAGLFGIPADAVAISGNLTITGQTDPGYVTVAPLLTSGVKPSTSTLNFPTRDTRANNITVALGAGGRLDAMYWTSKATSTANLVFDVSGYFANDATGAMFKSISPGRILDSRLGLGGRIFHPSAKQTVKVTGLFGVPAEAVAISGNVTVTGPTAAGYVTVSPSLTSGARPSTSTINFPVGDTRANGVIVALGAGGGIDIMYRGGSSVSTVNVVFDVTGYFVKDPTGATDHPIPPTRILDSRLALGATLFHAHVRQTLAVRGLHGVPSDAVAVTGNLTVTGQTAAGFVTMAPQLAPGVEPATSTINFPIGDTRANGITMPLSAGGSLDLMYWARPGSTAQIVFDVTGYLVHDPPSASSHAGATIVVAAADSPSDAVVAGTAAARLGAPFLLVAHNSVPAATAAEITRLRPDHALIVGGSASVTDAVLAQIYALVPTVERVSGSDTYGTASAVAARYFPGAATIVAMSTTTAATGPALVVLAVARTAPILYTQGTDLLPTPTRDSVLATRPTHIVLVGPASVINQAELVGFADGRLTKPADPTAYPTKDSGYHDPGELYTVIKAEEIAYPTLVHIFSIGKSYQGRDIWAAKVSSDVSVDADKPETLVDALHHADEHLGVEQALYLLETLTSGYDTDTYVHDLVDQRTTWIVFALNPDGWDHDLLGGLYHSWRKNMQPVAGSASIGTDINRNYAYKWGCCGGSSGTPRMWDYRGPSAFSTPEARDLANFVASRVVGGVQRIKSHVSLHTNGELILYPYSYTKTALTSDMAADDHAVFVAMARTMAGLDGYKAEQSSGLYISDGDEIDWLYHTYGIFSFTIELYPTDSTGASADAAASDLVADPLVIYPPYSIVAQQTARNRGMLLYVINQAACPYAAIGKTAQYCPGAPAILPPD